MNIRYLINVIIMLCCFELSIAQNDEIITLDPISQVGDDENILYFHEINSISFNKNDDRLYIVDSGNYRVVVLDKELNFISEFGRNGQGPGEFVYPTCISFDSNNSIYIGELLNFRIQILNQKYKYIGGFRVSISITDILLNSNGNVILTNANNDKLFTVFDNNGTKIQSFGELFHDKKKFMGSIRFQNRIISVIDAYDNIYCAFYNYPIIRKYDKNFNLVYESNYEYLEAAKKTKKQYEEKVDRQKPPKNNQVIRFTVPYAINMSLDEKYIYLKCLNENGILLFDKLTGQYSNKKVVFNYPNGISTDEIITFDFSAPDYIYGVYRPKELIVMYKKQSFN